jgi:hypothetical protein
MVVVGAILTVDWARLNEIGQSYTGISAIVSAAALVGVTISLRLQARQTELLQQQTARQFQFEILRIASSNPALSPAMVAALPVDDRSHEAFQLHAFQVQVFRFFEYNYLSDQYSDSSLENILEHEFFPATPNRQWWDRVRGYWLAESRAGRSRRFIEIVERVYAATEPPPPETRTG